MTTKPKASLYRLKPGRPLAAGVDAEAIARAAAGVVSPPLPTDGTAALKPEPAVPPKPTPQPAPEGQVEPAPESAAPKATEDAPDTSRRAKRVAKRNAEQDALKIGEVSSAREVDTENTIDTIRREGLTGRQLRMARRVAQKHGLTPTSDFDAVRLLRDKGIDPFSRANVLELVPSNSQVSGTLSMGTAVATQPQGDPKLPATVKQAPVPAKVEPKPKAKPAENDAHMGEIYKIQRDIARRRRRKLVLLGGRLFCFVFLPTLIVGWYYNFVATPMFATKSEFVIQQADAPSAGMGGLFAGTGLAVQQDSTTVQSYLQSRDAMLRLDEDLGFRRHFSQADIDPIQRLDEDASNEDTYAVFQKNVKVGYDPTEGILKMEVIAASPDASEAFSKALIGYAEEQVDNLTQRLRGDQMDGALANFDQAEAKVQAAQERVLDLQEKLGVLDPVSETGSLMQQITQFEVQLRTKQLEMQQLQSNARPSQARVNAVQGEIDRLEALVADLRRSMTEGQNGGVSLARVTGELRIAEADLATRQLLLQQAAQQLETARIEANRQTRYMAIGVNPVAPDEATYPRKFENTMLAFVIFAGIYLMISLTAAVLREQVNS